MDKEMKKRLIEARLKEIRDSIETKRQQRWTAWQEWEAKARQEEEVEMKEWDILQSELKNT